LSCFSKRSSQNASLSQTTCLATSVASLCNTSRAQHTRSGRCPKPLDRSCRTHRQAVMRSLTKSPVYFARKANSASLFELTPVELLGEFGLEVSEDCTRIWLDCEGDLGEVADEFRIVPERRAEDLRRATWWSLKKFAATPSAQD